MGTSADFLRTERAHRVTDLNEIRWLTYTEAARRVGRSDRNIRKWRHDGMTMSWRVGTDGQRERVVREDVLLAWFRDRLKASPTHYHRMRALARENGLLDPTPTAALSHPKAPRQPTAPTAEESASGGPVRSHMNEPARLVDPLADEKPIRGGPEYWELHRALQEDEPVCRDVDEYTADKTDPDLIPTLASICSRCPVLKQCAAFAAVSRPTVGFWAGQAATELAALRSM